MSDSLNSKVLHIDAEPFIYAPMELLRNVFTDASSAGKNMVGVIQVLDVVITDLEFQVLLAKLTNRTHIYQGKLLIADASQRARELQQLVLP